MTWFKVDDDLPLHEKMAALCEGPCRADAIALWTFGGCWSSRSLKEGFVPTGVVKSFGFHPEAPSELVRTGLWNEVEGGYRFHDWADYQPSAARVEERRRAGAERKAASRKRLSAPVVYPDVGESPCDNPTVTSVPRACLAHASRERDLDLNSSSSLRSEIASVVPTALADDVKAGRAWYVQTVLNGDEFQAPSVAKWKDDYAWIARQLPAERAAATKAARADTWVQANRRAANPGHFVKYWGKYAAGGYQDVPRAPKPTEPVSTRGGASHESHRLFQEPEWMREREREERAAEQRQYAAAELARQSSTAPTPEIDIGPPVDLTELRTYMDRFRFGATKAVPA